MDWELLGYGIGTAIGNKRRRDYYDNLQNQNSNNRGVYQTNAPFSMLIDRSWGKNTVISGGQDDMRNMAIVEHIQRCLTHGQGAVVLHSNNNALANMINQCVDREHLFNINSSNRIYEPLRGKTADAALRILSEVASGTRYSFDNNAYSFMDGITQYLVSQSPKLTLKRYCKCIDEHRYDEVQNEAEELGISYSVAANIQVIINNSKMSEPIMKRFLDDLCYQGNGALVDNAHVYSATNIKDILDENGIVVFDVGSVHNMLFIKLIITEILECIGRTDSFAFILDSIPMRSDNGLLAGLNSFRGDGYPFLVYTANDAFSKVESNNDVFNTLTGQSPCVYVLRHSSDGSAEKFSNAFGRYTRIALNESHNTGYNYSFNNGGGTYSNSGTQEQEILEYKVKPQEITGLNNVSAFVRLDGSNEIWYAANLLNNGIVTDIQREPTERPIGRRSSSNFSWWIFLILLIAFFPAGLIYLFVTGSRRVKITMGIILGVLLFMFIMFMATEVYS